METFSMRSPISASVMMIPLGETVRVTLRNFLALARACVSDSGSQYLNTQTHIETYTHIYLELVGLLDDDLQFDMVPQHGPAHISDASVTISLSCQWLRLFLFWLALLCRAQAISISEHIAVAFTSQIPRK